MILCLGCKKIWIGGEEGAKCPLCGGGAKFIPKEREREYIDKYSPLRTWELTKARERWKEKHGD